MEYPKIPMPVFTHRCEDSLKNDVSIRLVGGEWILSVPKMYWEHGSTYLMRVCPIRYCPFCGERLGK